MELNEQNLSELWDAWTGSKDMLVKGENRQMKPPKNFLGSIKEHKKKFLKFAVEWIKAKEENKTLKIICSAIWVQNGKKYEHQPKNIKSGIVICGRRHHNCIITASLFLGSPISKAGKVIQGFLTDTDEFVDRKKAGEIAFKAKQIKKETDLLLSEDLY